MASDSNLSSSKDIIFNHLLSSSDWQYVKLLEFINSTSEPFKTQLARLVYPLFVHFYLQFVTNGKFDNAQKFLEKHRAHFEDTQGWENVVDQLKGIKSVDDLKDYPLFKLFWEQKVIAELSEKCADYLHVFLQDMKCATVIYLLKSYFSLQSNGMENRYVPPDVLNDTEDVVPLNFDSSDEMSFGNVIRSVRMGPPCLPALSSYTLSTQKRRLNKICMSSKSACVAGGFEESDICVWYIPESTSCSAFSEEINAQKSQFKYLQGHSGSIYGISFTEDGQHLFSCSEDTTVRVWSMNSFENMAIYLGHTYPIWDIDTSPFSYYFATASRDCTARLFVTDRIYPVRIYIGHTSDVDIVKFHPNSNYLATSSSDRTICLWNVQSGNRIKIFKGQKSHVHSLAFSPNGLYLLSAGEDKLIRIWDIRMGMLLNELHGHTDTVCSLSCNSSNTLLASAGRDNTVKLWDFNKAYSHTANSHPEAWSEKENSPELLSSFAIESSLRKVSFINAGLVMSFRVS